ncbi:response regulator [Aliikangiella sp. IMCC44653]
MTTSILICDDSRMARNQLARCLPSDWDVQVTFAEDGNDCITKAAECQPKLIFLDLNMPEKDGYQTLEHFVGNDLDYNVIVVSGDIQPTAQQRVMNLGALDFIKKPIDAPQMLQTLKQHNYYPPATPSTSKVNRAIPQADNLNDEATFLDACQEVANVAMGRAGDSLARFLDVFVELPVPKVNHIELSELVMALQFAEKESEVSAVCQGFIGPGLSGEALLIFNDSSFQNIADLMKFQGEIDDQVQLELLMDIANILVGACLQGISDQLDINLSQGHPVVLGQHVSISDLIKTNKQWKKTLSIEINYSIEKKGVNCDLLLLITEECLPTLRERLSYIV